ncbi:MAG: ribosome-associated translation inhibitor RaiA [Coriobacteriales bacterium]|nr:ribosome-associated translation inhibitor RaiA [Coriobacteriales bacterium]
MDIKITGRKMTVSQKLKDYIVQKVEQSVKTFDIPAMNAEVVLHAEKNPANPYPAVVEITLYAKKHVIRTKEAGEDFYSAVDVAAAKVERQLRKYKTKVIDRKKGSEKIADKIEKTESMEDIALDIQRNEDVVRVKELELQPMSLESALVQIDLLEHDFFIFVDQMTDEINVLYRRHEGGYGLIKAIR